MRPPRLWPTLVFAVALVGAGMGAWAQDLPSSDGGGSSGSSGGSTGGGSSFNPPAASSFGSAPVPSSSSGTPSTTGTAAPVPAIPGGPIPNTPPGEPALPSTSLPPASSSFGGPSQSDTEAAAAGTQTEAPTNFVIPGGYGQGATTLTSGQGRLARPRFRYTGSVTLGLDDNVFSTPFNAKEIPAVTQEVVVEPAQPARIEYVTFVEEETRGGVIFPTRPLTVPVLIPAVEEKTETVELAPAIKPEKRTVSMVARTNVGFETQFATRKSVFTMDLNASSSVYTNRPGDLVDYNGSLAFSYLYRLTPRLQFSASSNLAYLSQPDIRRVNAPGFNTGDYLNGFVKADLTYRWTRRFSTVSSVSVNTTQYFETLQEAGSFYDLTFGTEARYQFSPRLVTLGEVRYSTITYDVDSLRDSNSLFLLIGGEMVLTRRINASVRFGVQTRTFANSDESKLSPYTETNVSWRYSPAGGVNWTTRLGFEEPPDAATTVQVLRSTLSVSQAFSARLRATASLTGIQRLSDRDFVDQVETSTQFSIDAGMEYTLTKHMTLTGSYSFLSNFSNFDGQNFLRNQIFFGVQYAF